MDNIIKLFHNNKPNTVTIKEVLDSIEQVFATDINFKSAIYK